MTLRGGAHFHDIADAAEQQTTLIQPCGMKVTVRVVKHFLEQLL